jgi:hypothetical protein
MFTAWHTAVFTRQKRIPPLDRVMGTGKRQPASPDALMAKVIALNAAFGGKDKRNG